MRGLSYCAYFFVKPFRRFNILLSAMSACQPNLGSDNRKRPTLGSKLSHFLYGMLELREIENCYEFTYTKEHKVDYLHEKNHSVRFFGVQWMEKCIKLPYS